MVIISIMPIAVIFRSRDLFCLDFSITIPLCAAILKKRSIPLPSIRTFTLPSHNFSNLFKPDHLQAAGYFHLIFIVIADL